MPAHTNMALGFAQQNSLAGSADKARMAGLMYANKRIKEAKATWDPYVEYGQQGMERLNKLFADPSYLENLPGYQFALQQGLKATTAMRSRTSIFSGETLKALTDYAAGLASQTYGQEYERLNQQMGVGMNALNVQTGLSQTQAEIAAGMGESRARMYDQQSANLAGEINFGRQIFGQWSGAMAGATAQAAGSGRGGG